MPGPSQTGKLLKKPQANAHRSLPSQPSTQQDAAKEIISQQETRESPALSGPLLPAGGNLPPYPQVASSMMNSAPPVSYPYGRPLHSQPLVGGPALYQPGKRKLFQRVRARYQRLSRRSKILLGVLAFCIVLPMLLTIAEGINAFILYQQAQSGIQHFKNVSKIFAEPTQNGRANIFNVEKLQRAQQEIDAAHHDFGLVNDTVHNSALISLLGGMLPAQISTIRALSDIGLGATEIAQQGIKSVITVAPDAPDPTMKDENKPLVNEAMLDQMRVLIDFAMPRVKEMATVARGIDTSSLPLGDAKGTLDKALTLLPNMVDDLEMVQDGLKTKALDWIIGADQPRSFLVQTMDRAELRSTGGFTGQFGELDINGGRVKDKSFQLQNVGIYEQSIYEKLDPVFNSDVNAHVEGNVAEEPYDWWPVPNFGIRDSNVSADFPNSANVTIDLFNKLYPINHPGIFKNVQGLIVFSPFLVGQVLRITGPVIMKAYHETVTADNLEEKLHYYQLDNQGIWKVCALQHFTCPGDWGIARKKFTSDVSQEIMKRIKSLSSDMLINIIPMMLQAMKTRDFQVYFRNQEAENWIAKYGFAGRMDTSNDHDGIFIVQSNVSTSKASQFVRTYVQDNVTLDAMGGATHILILQLAYTEIGNIYGHDNYIDYVRVYVPENSQYLGGYGFAQMPISYCGYGTDEHPSGKICGTDVFHNGMQICPPGSDTYERTGFRPLTTDGEMNFAGIHEIGEPTNMTSDTARRAMFGGFVEVMKNCNMTVSLSWYVPNVAKDKPYSLLFQRQGGTFPIVDMNILPTPGDCAQLKTSGLHFNGVLGGEDKMFTVPTQKEIRQQDCYIKMQV